MLILTRKKGEKIIIGDVLAEIMVLGIEKNQVRIGIEADKEIGIHREEIYKRILEEQLN